MKFISDSTDTCSYKLRSLRLRQFDQFGTVPGFQIRGSDKFQTNVGAILTFFFVVLIILSTSFYTYLLFNKSNPNVYTNTYDTKRETSIDFEKDDIAWSFSAWASNIQKHLSIKEFEENFTLYAAKISFNTTGEAVYPSWTPVPYVKCKDVKKDYIFDNTKLSTQDESICLDSSSLSLHPKLDSYVEKVFVKLYRCQETTENIAAGITKCKNDIILENIFWIVKRIKKSINLNKYENPVSNNLNEFDSFHLDEKLKATALVSYQKTIIETEKGLQGLNHHKSSKIEEKSTKYHYTTRSSKQIFNNYSDLGKLFMEDSLWEINFVPTKTIKVINRSYFTIMDFFAGVGGVFEFMSALIFCQYSFYNIYRVYKHIIQKVILGKVNMLPERYNIKKEFNHITRGKTCSCFFKKQLSDNKFINKMKVYDNCYQAVNEKMDLANYLNDSMNFHATSHLLLKSRHRLLVPLLNLHMIGQKNKSGMVYKNSFLKNMYERVDLPVFSVEDAMSQINKNASKSTAENLSSIEKAMDVFFMTNLPRNIIDQKDCNLERINIIPVVLANNKVRALSQQNLANIIREEKTIEKLNPKFSSKNKIMPTVSTIQKQSDKKKYPSAIELHDNFNDQNTTLKQSLEESGINRLKRKRKSFIGQLITQQDIIDSNSKNFNLTQASDKSIFQKAISLAKQAKLNSLEKKNTEMEKDYSEFGYHRKESDRNMRKKLFNEDLSKSGIELSKEQNKLLYKLDVDKKPITPDFNDDLQYDPFKNQKLNELIDKGAYKSIESDTENIPDQELKEVENNVVVDLKLGKDYPIEASINFNIENETNLEYREEPVDQQKSVDNTSLVYSFKNSCQFEDVQSNE